MGIAAALAEVREQLRVAALAGGRDPADITLIAVSKTQPVAALLEAYDAGARDFGENTAQELADKAVVFAERGLAVRWHFIGRLQRNKVNLVVRHAHIIHTVDRPPLAEALSARAPEAGLDVLVQVNIGAEPQKGGVAPDTALPFALSVTSLPRLRLRGLMAVPPADVAAGEYFAALADLSRNLQKSSQAGDATALSMGMSHDFAEAVRHGATMVRVGTAIFGARTRLKENK